MRLFFLPISTRRAILYCERIAHDKTSESTITKKVTDKANQTWTNWERAESGWKKHLTVFGNKVLSRIPMEEWSLKSVPPLSKQIKREILADIGASGGSQAKKALGARGASVVAKAKTEVNVLFPGSFLKEESVLSRLQQLAVERKPLHRRRFWWSLIGMPAVAPFALIPIVPNVPFFYLVYRAWSHWRALRGAEHLEFLYKYKLLRAKPSPMLDELYAAGLIHPSRDPARDSMPISPEQIRKVAASVASAQQEQQQQEQSQLQRNFLSKTDTAPFLSSLSASSVSSRSSHSFPSSPSRTSSNATLSEDSNTSKSTTISKASSNPIQSQINPTLQDDLHHQNIKLIKSEDEDLQEDQEGQEDQEDQEDQERSKDDITNAISNKDKVKEDDADKGDIMLLRRWNGKLLAERLKLPDMEIEIERAVEQVQSAIEQARKERMQSAEMKRVQAEIAAEERRQENWR